MKGKLSNNQAITLVALVISIVIIIILATIAINFAFGENGLITKAQQAAEMTAVAQVQEQLEMAKGSATIDGAGEIDPDHYFDIIEEEGIIGDKDTDVVDNGDGSYDVTTDGDYVFEVTPTPEGDVEIEYVGKNDEPRISQINVTDKTENSVTVEVVTKNVDNAEYTYLYKKTDESEGTWQEAGNGSDSTFTISGLENNTSYDIKVTVTAGDTTIEKTITVQIGTGVVEVPDNTITFGQPQWQGDGTARMTISTTEPDFTLQYQIGGTSGEWITITSGQSITGLRHGNRVYARLTDGTDENTSEIQQTTIEDTKVPTVNVALDTSTSNSISVNVTATDAESGMVASPRYTYYIKQSSQGDENYQAPSGATEITSNTYTFENLTSGISYDIKVEVKSDVAGNTGVGTLLNQTTTSIPGGEAALEDGTITIGEPTWADGSASITVSTTSQYYLEYKINDTTEGGWTRVDENGTISNLHDGDKVNIRLTDGTNAGGCVTKEIKDEKAPTVSITPQGTTSSSVSVDVIVIDDESGMIENPTYTYYIKKTGEEDNQYVVKATDITESSYTFTGLEDNTSYDVKVDVKSDVAGNMGTGTLENQMTERIPAGDDDIVEGAITFGEVSWNDGEASITISTSTSYKIEYTKSNPEENEGWTEIENNGSITGLNHGDTIYARLTDGNNHGDYATSKILDGTNPVVTVTANGSPTSSSISVSVSAQDNESGMADSITYTYYIKQSSQGNESYTTPSGATGISQSTYTFTGLIANTSYDVKVEVTGDKTGNTGTGTLENQSTTGIPGGDSSLDDGSITISEPEWNDGKATITVETNTDFDVEYQIGDEGEWKPVGEDGKIPNLNPGDKVNIHLTDGTNDGENVTVTIEDEILPEVTVTASGSPTSNSISVKVSAVDNESGMADNVTYTYYIKTTGEQDSSYVAKATDIAENTYTFTGLEDGTSYDIKVDVKADKAGNTGTGTLLNQSTTSVPGGEGILGNQIEVGETVWADGKASITVSTDTGYSVEYQVNSTAEGSWTNIGDSGTVQDLGYGDTVNIRLTDGSNKGDLVTVTIDDEINPEVNVSLMSSTSNGIAVSVSATDAESGMSSNPVYTYYIKESTEADSEYAAPENAKEITANTYTFTGLKQNTSYDIKVEVKADKAGNMGTGTLLNQKTSTIPGGDQVTTDGTLTIGEPTWSSGKASITVSTNTSYQIEYQVNGTAEGSWQNVTGGSIGNLNHGDEVNIRLTDGENAGGYVTKEIQDTTVPTVTVTASGSPTSNSISVSVSAQDNESGMASSLKYTYYIKQHSQEDGSYEKQTNGTNISSNTYTFTGLQQGTSYDVKVEVTGDKAGNTGSGTLLNQTTQSIPGGNEGVTQGVITFGTVSWSDGQASITVSTNTGYKIEYKKSNPESEEGWTEIANNGSITGLNHGDTVYARLTDGDNHGDYATTKIMDGKNPVVTVTSGGTTTSSSIKVNVSATDAESGMAASLKYTYYIKQSSEADSAYKTQTNSTNLSTNTYTFTGLTQDTSYDIKVEVTGDVAGNTGTGYLAGQTTQRVPDASGEDIQEGAITFSTATWSNNKATISVSTNTSYNIEYQVGATTESSWIGIANKGTISNLNYNDTVYARLTDGVNHGAYATTKIIETTVPQAATIDLSGTSTDTDGSITATVTLRDNESGVNTTGSKWIYNTNAGNIGTDEASYTNSFTTNPETLTLSVTTPGTYYLHVLTKDVAGNKVETISEAIIVRQLVTSISVSPTSATITERETQQLTATILPGNASNKEVQWSSNNESIASVNSSGLVTAKAAGSVTITVKTTDGSNKQATCSITVKAKIPETTEEAKPTEGQDGPTFETTTPITDATGSNTVVIPGGFHLDKDSGTSVEEGIVIEDGSGNQFVWIPTGTYQTSSGSKTNNLSRRTFTSIGATEVSGDTAINTYFYGEGDSRSVAYSQIGAFKDSVSRNGGFYIGRYELGSGNVVKAGVAPSTNITRDNAKSNIENMYKGNSYVVSELISSYAWDTALNFICQTNSAGYTLATTTDSSYGNINTGSMQNTGVYATDNYSNIHDLLGNCVEWTTEYAYDEGAFAVRRGGRFNFKLYHASTRFQTNSTYASLSARAQLYVK